MSEANHCGVYGGVGHHGMVGNPRRIARVSRSMRFLTEQPHAQLLTYLVAPGLHIHGQYVWISSRIFKSKPNAVRAVLSPDSIRVFLVMFISFNKVHDLFMQLPTLLSAEKRVQKAENWAGAKNISGLTNRVGGAEGIWRAAA